MFVRLKNLYICNLIPKSKHTIQKKSKMACYRILTKNDLRNHYFAIGEEALKRIDINRPITLICNGKVYENRNIDKCLGYGHLYARKEFFDDNRLEVDDRVVFDVEESSNTIRISVFKKGEIININMGSETNTKESNTSKKCFKPKNKKAFTIRKSYLLDAISRKNNIELIEAGLKPFEEKLGQLGKSIKRNSFLRYKSQDGIVLVMVDNKTEKLDYIIKQLKKTSDFENMNIRGILIKPFDKSFNDNLCTIEESSNSSNSIKVLYCKFDFSIQEKQPNSIPIKLSNLKDLNEDHVRDYFLNHLCEIENNLRPFEDGYEGCRDYKIKGRKIDLFCKDKNDRPVVVEIKKRIEKTYNSYDAVGQILCYIRLSEKEKSLDNVRGVILIPKDSTEVYKNDILLALECCEGCRKIDLLYYCAELSFVE